METTEFDRPRLHKASVFLMGSSGAVVKRICSKKNFNCVWRLLSPWVKAPNKLVMAFLYVSQSKRFLKNIFLCNIARIANLEELEARYIIICQFLFGIIQRVPACSALDHGSPLTRPVGTGDNRAELLHPRPVGLGQRTRINGSNHLKLENMCPDYESGTYCKYRYMIIPYMHICIHTHVHIFIYVNDSMYNI